ncbi:hypothetical protein RND71_030561 [Anisodus tanguticus]|uniref:Uncharacterized protein n=1 Tax=Anisodus tanguticus TaxID=243964 RepID=A0AAE1UZT8_9SOLA|nr:hypothetical protein RND71_030561 [Anisodus tanguticus]
MNFMSVHTRTGKHGEQISAEFSQFPMATGSSPDMRVWERRLLCSWCCTVPNSSQ